MAFDQSTRTRLQKLVNSCRGLLSDEFSIQLQQNELYQLFYLVPIVKQHH